MRIFRFPFVLVSVFVFIITFVLIASFDAPWAKNQLEKLVRENCEGCEFSVESARIAWRGLVLSNVFFASGKKGAQRLESKIVRAVIRPEILPLFKGAVHVDSVTVFGPEVVFSEGDLKEKDPAQADDNKASNFELNRVALYEGKFVYIRDHKGTHGVLTVNDIEGKLDFADSRAKGKFNARMGESGNFDLFLSAGLKKPLDVDAELFIRDQNLDDLTVFLKPNAGVELKGILLKAHSESKVRGTKLNSKVTVTFKDFKVQLHEMYDRSELQAFFVNLGAQVALKKENVQDTADEKTKSVDTQREKGESLVHFILTGLKEAALKAAK